MFISILNLVFCAIAAAVGIYTIVHNIRQKRKADLSIVVLSFGGGEENIAIKNNGEADAKNISLTFLQSSNIRFDNEALSTAIISKGQQYNISFHPIPKEKNIRCDLEWDDKKGHHKKTQNIQIIGF